MAWSTPRTWTVGEVLTAANMNTYISNNLAYLHGDAGVAIDLSAGGQGLNAIAFSTGNANGAMSGPQGMWIGSAGIATAAGGSAGQGVFSSGVVADGQPRHVATADGGHTWGSGAATADVALQRNGANTLQIYVPAGTAPSLILGSGSSTATLGQGGTGGVQILASTAHKLGVYGATPVAQPTNGTPASGSSYSDAGATVVHSGGSWSGGVGTKFYSVDQIVYCLKTLGLIAS